MRPIPYLVCVLCVQEIAEWQRDINSPSTSEWDREVYKSVVLDREHYLEEAKQRHAAIVPKLQAAMGHLEQLQQLAKQGE